MFGYPRSTEGDARLAASMAVELALLARERQGDVALRRAGAELKCALACTPAWWWLLTAKSRQAIPSILPCKWKATPAPAKRASEAYRQLLRGLAEFEPAGRVRAVGVGHGGLLQTLGPHLAAHRSGGRTRIPGTPLHRLRP